MPRVHKRGGIKIIVVDRVKSLPLALKAEQNVRVSCQSLYKFLRTDKIHPIIRRIQLERELRELSVASEEELLSLE